MLIVGSRLYGEVYSASSSPTTALRASVRRQRESPLAAKSCMMRAISGPEPSAYTPRDARSDTVRIPRRTSTSVDGGGAPSS